jgi:hypothetical protein
MGILLFAMGLPSLHTIGKKDSPTSVHRKVIHSPLSAQADGQAVHFGRNVVVQFGRNLVVQYRP